MRELKGECKSASVTCCEVTQSGSCVAEPPPPGVPLMLRGPGGGGGRGPRSPTQCCSLLLPSQSCTEARGLHCSARCSQQEMIRGASQHVT